MKKEITPEMIEKARRISVEHKGQTQTLRYILLHRLESIWRNPSMELSIFIHKGWYYAIYKALYESGIINIKSIENGIIKEMTDDQKKFADAIIEKVIWSFE